MNNKVFLDTSYAIALVSPQDNYYQKAIKIAEIIEIKFINLVTTQAILLEIGNAFKQWGLVDCLSFIVMKKYNITEALTADIHFQQAGFKALLREEFSQSLFHT